MCKLFLLYLKWVKGLGIVTTRRARAPLVTNVLHVLHRHRRHHALSAAAVQVDALAQRIQSMSVDVQRMVATGMLEGVLVPRLLLPLRLVFASLHLLLAIHVGMILVRRVVVLSHRDVVHHHLAVAHPALLIVIHHLHHHLARLAPQMHLVIHIIFGVRSLSRRRFVRTDISAKRINGNMD